jgi:hypothetical protein
LNSASLGGGSARREGPLAARRRTRAVSCALDMWYVGRPANRAAIAGVRLCQWRDVIIKRACLVIALLLSGSAAFAASATGPSALALAALTAEHDSALSAAKRHVVAKLFAGHTNFPYPAGQNITIKADKIVCRVSDVAIVARSCALTFGVHTVNLTGRRANALFATIAVAGVPPDGAAGSIFEALHGLDCTLEPSVIKQNAGGGATCAFTAGP